MIQFSIRFATGTDLDSVFAFHTANVGEYVWPRTLAQLTELVESRSVLVVETATAIITHFLVDDPPENQPLIAHVHEFNPSNIRSVLERLGFVRSGEETPPIDVVPPNMKRNVDGLVVGELYKFSVKHLQKLANWVQAEDSQLFTVDIDWFDRDEVVLDLIEMLAQRTSTGSTTND